MFPCKQEPTQTAYPSPLFHQPSGCKGQGHSGLPDSSSHLYTQQILECATQGCTVVKRGVTYLRVLLTVH